MKRLRERVTYANVIATVALFVALGGTAYAAVKLPKNSVGAKQLKKNSVTGAKVKNGSLTGADIKSSTLGQVPSAANAANAASLGGLPSSAFAASSHSLFGTADTSIASSQTLFTVPGAFQVATVPSATTHLEVRFVSQSADEWAIVEPEGTIQNLLPNSSATARPTGLYTVTLVALDVPNPAKSVLVQCGWKFNSARLNCFATLSPAL